MKYKQFIFLRNSIIGFLIVGTSWFLCRQPTKVDEKVTTETNTNTTNNNTTTNNNNNSSSNTSLYRLTTGEEITAAHEEIMALQKSSALSSGKPDDNNGGVKLFKKLATYQVDLRCDKAKGFTYFNRVKIDWDYDKKWDEKWDFRENGSIKRQCSTNDDENYDLVQETVNGKWKTEGSTNNNASNNTNTTTTNNTTTNTATSTLSALQQEVLKIQKNTSLSEGKPDDNNGGLKCYKKMGSYFVDLRCDKTKGFDYWNRVKIDWDMDKNWDEKWDIRADGSIKRQFSRKDDNNYDVTEELK